MARIKYKGVFVIKSSKGKRYRAIHSKKSLGTFPTAEQAAKAKDLGALAVARIAGKKAGKLNLSRAEYTEEQIKDMMEYLSRGKAAASAPYRNVDFRKGRFEARIRYAGMRLSVGGFEEAEEAALEMDLVEMVLKGVSSTTDRRLRVDWTTTDPEMLLSERARVRAKLLDKLRGRAGQAAADRVIQMLEIEDQQQPMQQPERQQPERQQPQRRSASQGARQTHKGSEPQRRTRSQQQAHDMQQAANSAQQALGTAQQTLGTAQQALGTAQQVLCTAQQALGSVQQMLSSCCQALGAVEEAAGRKRRADATQDSAGPATRRRRA